MYVFWNIDSSVYDIFKGIQKYLLSFKIGINLKINLDGEKDKPDVKPKEEPDIKPNEEQKPITNSNREQKSNINLKQDVKPITDSNRERKPDIKLNKITYEEEKVALVLGITSVFTVWWLFK